MRSSSVLTSTWTLVIIIAVAVAAGIFAGRYHHDHIARAVMQAIWSMIAVLGLRVIYLQTRVIRQARTRANIAALASYMCTAAAAILGATGKWERLPWIVYAAGTGVLYYALHLRRRELNSQ